jgi:activator of 2-hydroxyglutaryl-CoA dehydratase
MITAGVDIGSLTAKALILNDNEILSYSLIQTGADSVETARSAMGVALRNAGMLLSDVEFIVSTGYGRALVPFAHKNITEISCHADLPPKN